MIYLYPRLPASTAAALYEQRRGEFEDGLTTPLRNHGALEHPDQTMAATGGAPVPVETLQVVQARFRALLDDCGWPAKRTEPGRQRFDAEGSRILHETMSIIPADAGAAGVWTFMSLVLLPEAAPWRWPTWNQQRFLEHPRNTFRSLYWRGFILGTEEGGRLQILGEDEITAIIERPSLSANPRVARAIYEPYLQIRDHLGGASPMFLMRDYAKRLRRITAFVDLDGQDDAGLAALCSELLQDSLDAFEVAPDPDS